MKKLGYSERSSDSKTFTLSELTSYLHELERQSERSRWNVSDSVFDVLHDMSMLTAYKKLILPMSTFAFWGGFLSDAKEVCSLLTKLAVYMLF